MSIKTVDYYYDDSIQAYQYKDPESDVPAELCQPEGGGGGGGASIDDDWREYVFVVVRTLPRRSRTNDQSIKFKIVVKDSHLLKACREVIGELPGLSWNSEPVKVSCCRSLC